MLVLSPMVLAMEISGLLKIAMVILCIGFLLITIYGMKTMIKIVGVGGETVNLFTNRKDANRIKEELNSKIQNLAK